jgi:hypothetical protein
MPHNNTRELDPRLALAAHLLDDFFGDPEAVTFTIFTVRGVEHCWGSCARAGSSGDLYDIDVASTRQAGFRELIDFDSCGGCAWNFRPGGDAGVWAERVLSPVYAANDAVEAHGLLARGTALSRIAKTALIGEGLVEQLLTVVGQGTLHPGPVALVRRDPHLPYEKLGTDIATAFAAGVHHKEGWSLLNTSAETHPDVLLLPLGELTHTPPATAAVFFSLLEDEGVQPTSALLRAATCLAKDPDR